MLYLSVVKPGNYISILLLVVILWTILPKELFHFFHDHEDEIAHVELTCHDKHFEKKHEHCPSLKFVTSPFLKMEYFQQNVFILLLENRATSVFLNHVKSVSHYLFSIKAPPAF